MILNLASEETLDWQDGNQMETKEWKQGYLEHSDYAQSGQISEKADVYSFGVVLVEFVTGRKAVDLSRAKGSAMPQRNPWCTNTHIVFITLNQEIPGADSKPRMWPPPPSPFTGFIQSPYR